MPTIKRFSPADRSLIAATFEQIRSRHAGTVENLADIMIDLKRIKRLMDDNDEFYEPHTCSIDPNLSDSFLRRRLSIQLLCDHFVGLHKGKPAGGVSINCNLMDIVTDAVLEATHICDANLGMAPEVQFLWNDLESVDSKSDNVTSLECALRITLVRPWVHHAFVELLKNAMAATIKKSTALKDTSLPDIYLQINSVGKKFIVCNIIDQGTGLDANMMSKAFCFAESSFSKRWDRIEEQQSYAMVRAPLGSLGVGLTLSQMMLQHLGGDACLVNRKHGKILLSNNREMKIDSGCTAQLILCRDEEWLLGDSQNFDQNLL